MKIALLAHIRHPIAEPFKGGMEAHTSLLANQLIKRGHDVYLLASGDSQTQAKLVPIIDRHYDADLPWHQFHATQALFDLQTRVFEYAFEQIKQLKPDVIHNNSLHHDAIKHAYGGMWPMLSAMHVPPFEYLKQATQSYCAPYLRYSAASDVHLSQWAFGQLPACTIYNGVSTEIDADQPVHSGALWVGRIARTKGLEYAIDACVLAGMPLRILGPIEEQDYFDQQIYPRLKRHLGITYEGIVSGSHVRCAMAGAEVLVFTPVWPEPFGLVAAESIMQGTPVAGFNSGAVSEVVTDCGVVVPARDTRALAQAIRAAVKISRSHCRAQALKRFSADTMVSGYEREYQRAIEARRALSS